ncbi:MAG TPA: TonB-dependent receptor [Candidatus Kapabacteria bacterium]|nr:TonB-dependent receptor [Candidatus Kapabacteria bacterium]
MKYFHLLIAICFTANLSLFSQTDHIENITKDSLKVYTTPSITVSSGKQGNPNQMISYPEISHSEIIQSYYNQDLPLILSKMPSVIAYSENGGGIGYSNLSIRGFDQRRIAVMINGVPQNDPEDHNFYWINLSDLASSLENIEVQRGAGMSMYGPAAIAGSVNLSTLNYFNHKGINFSTGIGYQEFGSRGTEQVSSRFGLEFSSGLVDKYAFYSKISRINSFGYRDNSWAYLTSYFVSAARVDDNFITQINVYGGMQDDALAYNGLPQQYIKDKDLRLKNYGYFSYDNDGTSVSYFTKRRNQEVEKFSQPIIELLNDWQISDKVRLKSSIFFKVGEGYFDFDGTGWTDKNSFQLTPENGFIDAKDPQNPIIRSYVGNKTYGWIPKLEIANSLGNLLIGAEFRFHNSIHWGKIEYAEDLPLNYDPDYQFYSYDGGRKIISLFASQKFDISDKFKLGADLQIVYHNYTINNEKLGRHFTSYKSTDGTIGNGDDLFSVNYVFFNPRLSASYQLDNTNKLYFSSAFTSREPRMKNLYSASDSWTGALPQFETVISGNDTLLNFSKPLVKPEKMLDIELGWEFTSEDVVANINLYAMEYFDELVKSGQLDLFGMPIDGNAPRTSHYGVELSANANIFSNKYGKLNIGANLTASSNKIVEWNYMTEKGEAISLAGNKVNGFPDLMANLMLSYSIKDLNFNLRLNHIGEMQTDNFGDMIRNDARIKEDLGGEYYLINILDSYTTLNANLSYNLYNVLSFQSLRLHLHINNLTNEIYASYAIGKEFFPAAERNFYFGIELGI